MYICGDVSIAKVLKLRASLILGIWEQLEVRRTCLQMINTRENHVCVFFLALLAETLHLGHM